MSKHESKSELRADTEVAAEERVNQGRRRLGKAALAAPVVIASLSARPAMACSVSGFISGNTSPGHGDYDCGGYGCTPGFWKNNVEAWRWTGLNPGSCALMQGSNCKQWNPDTGTKLFQILPPGGMPPSGCDYTGNYFPQVNPGDSLMYILAKGVTSGGKVTTEYADVLHYIAAVLNASAGSGAYYGSTVTEVQQGLCKAGKEGTINHYTTVLLAGLNERGCMYNAHGDCAQNFTKINPYEGVCIPVCPNGTVWDNTTMSCK